jgi:hypothetical protein
LAGGHLTPTSSSSNSHLKALSHYEALAWTAKNTLFPTVTQMFCVTQPLHSNDHFFGSTVFDFRKYASVSYNLKTKLGTIGAHDESCFHELVDEY